MINTICVSNGMVATLLCRNPRVCEDLKPTK